MNLEPLTFSKILGNNFSLFNFDDYPTLFCMHGEENKNYFHSSTSKPCGVEQEPYFAKLF